MTPHLDEVPVPHFEDRLWHELAQAHANAAADAADTGGSGAVRPGRTGRTPRGSRARRFVALGVGSLAAAAALVAGVVVVGSDADRSGTGTRGRSGSSPTDPAPSEPAPPGEEAPGEEAPALDLAAEIRQAVDEAAADSVVHVVQDMTTGPGDSETWTDETSGASRSLSLSETGAPTADRGWRTPPTPDQQPPGFPATSVPPELRPDPDPGIREDQGVVTVPMVMQRYVDYCFRVYVDLEAGASPPRNEGERMAAWLAEGKLVEDGTEVVDGRELIRLVQPPGGADSVYLVDPETYRPVRLTSYPGGEAEYTMTFEYLPRTPENLAVLSPPVPEGFTRADVLPDDGDRHDAGCPF
jgi:hypothetical protein